VSGAMRRPTARADLSCEGRQLSMQSKPPPHDGVVALDPQAENGRSQARRPLGDGAAHRFAGFEQEIAHLPRPSLFVDVDPGLEFAQMMGVESAWRTLGHR